MHEFVLYMPHLSHTVAPESHARALQVVCHVVEWCICATAGRDRAGYSRVRGVGRGTCRTSAVYVLGVGVGVCVGAAHSHPRRRPPPRRPKSAGAGTPVACMAREGFVSRICTVRATHAHCTHTTPPAACRPPLVQPQLRLSCPPPSLLRPPAPTPSAWPSDAPPHSREPQLARGQGRVAVAVCA